MTGCAKVHTPMIPSVGLRSFCPHILAERRFHPDRQLSPPCSEEAHCAAICEWDGTRGMPPSPLMRAAICSPEQLAGRHIDAVMSSASDSSSSLEASSCSSARSLQNKYSLLLALVD